MDIKEKKTKWDRDEVEELYKMSMDHCTISMMSRKLKRSRWNIIHALKWIQIQQLMFHPLHEVAALHNIEEETLVKRVKDPVFYIEPSKKNGVPTAIIVSSCFFALVSLYGRFCCKDIL